MAGDAQPAGDVRGRPLFEVPEADDLPVLRRQLVDHRQQQAHRLLLGRRRLGRRAGRGERPRPRRGRSRRARPGVQRNLEAPRPPDGGARRFVAHDRGHPAARGRAAAVLPDLLHHDQPALLQGVAGRVVVPRHAPGHRHEACRAAPDPRLRVVVQERTAGRFLERGSRERRGRLLHGRRFCGTHAGRSRTARATQSPRPPPARPLPGKHATMKP